MNKQQIIWELNFFMENCYPHYNPVDWSDTIEKYAEKANKYPLCECKGVWITEKEITAIESLQNKVLERLAFTLLCLAKFKNFKNPNNSNWVNYSNGEIYSMACITTSSFEKDNKLSILKEMDMIKFAKKIDNLSIQVLYIYDDSKPILFISDFRRLGYEWRLYNGEKYIRCNKCGILVKNTNGKRKLCKDCDKTNNKEKTLEMYFKSKI